MPPVGSGADGVPIGGGGGRFGGGLVSDQAPRDRERARAVAVALIVSVVAVVVSAVPVLVVALVVSWFRSWCRAADKLQPLSLCLVWCNLI